MTGIPASELAERRKRAAAAAKAKGLNGLLVVSRGGGTLDRYGDVLYLANFYTSFPYIPDLPGAWTGRAHAFLVLTAEAEPHLVIDCPNDGRIALQPAEIERSDLVIESVVAALRRMGLDHGRIGLAGIDVLSVAAYRTLAAALPGVTFEDAGAILAELRAIKSPAEIALLRRASSTGSRMIEAMMDAAVPGATHGDVVAAGQQVLTPARGILYNSFMASGRGGDNPQYVRSNFPTWNSEVKLENGQWFRIGISGALDGYMFDLSRSKPIGPPTNRQVELFEHAIECVETGIAAVRPGATAEEVAAAGLDRQRALGYDMTGVFSGLGHGLGLGWDAPWLAPGDRTAIKPGMVLCFERTILQDGFLGDFEETVLVTEDGAEKITDARIRSW
jgi:Xaa-Pro aminopeptidase